MSRSTTLRYLSHLICLVTLFFTTESLSDQTGVIPSFESPLLVKKDQRTPIIATEFGEISAVQIGDGYHLQFITLEPNSLLLPLLLHSDMVFFVHTGTGVLNWIDEEKEKTLELRRGDVYRLHSGTVFYLHSNEVPEKFRVYAIFDVEKCLYDPCLGAYSSIRDLLLGFDDKTLQSAFSVPEDLLGRLRNATKPPLITNALPRNRTQEPEENKWQSRLARLFVREEDVIDHLAMRPIDSNKKKSKAYNVFEADPDFKNDYGQSIVVDKKDLHALKHSGFGVFMVNLTKGSMMGPHWNPRASEISIVLRGEGMIRVANQQSLSSCKSERFMVEEGDVFVVPKFHPMAQMSFENSSFVFMGFSTSVKKNHPQFLVGEMSVLKVLDPGVLALSFNLRNETVKRLLEAQKESLMFECVSCAEGELAKLMKEIEEKIRREEEERKREEEEAKRREEEKRRREEEEIERRRREEEEAKKREEEAAKRREEEKKRREEAAEEVRKREEERQREEEEAKKREEEAEEARKREERQREEEEAKRREEERKRHEEEAEEARKREEEREKEEEMAKKREQERQKKEREEQERKRREEEAMRKREEERKREEAAKRAEEERRKREEEEEEEQKRLPPPQPPYIVNRKNVVK